MKKLLFTIVFAIISIGLMSQTKTLTPELISPVDTAENQMPNVELNWQAVSGIGEITYEIWLGEDPQFDIHVEFTNTLSKYDMVNLLFGKDYFWKVRAWDEENDTSDWSEPWQFTVFDVFDLKKPNDGSEENEPNEELKWEDEIDNIGISGFDYFHYEVSLDEGFTEPVYLSDSVSSDLFEVNTVDLLFDTTYFWRMKARHDEDESNWTDVWSFSIIDVVTLKDPDNEETDLGIEVELEWDDIEGLIGYTYEFCTNPDFNPPCLVNLVTDDEVLVESLSFGTTYYWRINALHAADTTEWSEEWSFETINTVILDSPDDGSTINDPTPVFEWDEIDGVSGYELHFGTNLSDPEIRIILGADNNDYQVILPLEVEETYSWQVRAFVEGDTTEWSEDWDLTIESQSIDDYGLTEENVNIFPNPSNGKLNIELIALKQMNVQVSVMDLLGQVVKEKEFTFNQGLNTQVIDLSDIYDGIYIVKIISGETVLSNKIIIDK